MPRRLAFLLLLASCAPDPAQEAERTRAALDSHRASLRALGMAAAPRAAPAPAPRGTARASQFIGATPAALLEALGEPSLKREEGGAAVWLYAAGGCQLDVVLYAGAQGLRVAHVQARAGGIAQRTEAACLRDIQAAARRTPPGSPPAELGA